MESKRGNERVVCVTGASGFIASWLVKLLLLRGYTVKATVRDPNDSKKVQHLLELEGAKERLSLIKANLLEEGSFDSAIEGCDGVFHTASPVSFDAKDPQTELIDPAVKGTLNVLKSCAKSSSLKRVVLTSSMATVLYNGKSRNPKVVVDETWFSNPEFCNEYEGNSIPIIIDNVNFASTKWIHVGIKDHMQPILLMLMTCNQYRHICDTSGFFNELTAFPLMFPITLICDIKHLFHLACYNEGLISITNSSKID